MTSNTGIGADAAKLAGLQVDMLQKYRSGQITLAELEWYFNLKSDERQGLMKGLAREPKPEPVPIPTPDLSPIIKVDRSQKPAYPEWVTEALYPKLEQTGPWEFDITSLELYLHEKQKSGSYIGGHDLHKHLKKQEMLAGCLGLTDILAIQARGIEFFRKHFQGKAVFAWKSIVQNSGRLLRVPCLYEDGGQVVLGWDWLGRGWRAGNPALRFAS